MKKIKHKKTDAERISEAAIAVLKDEVKYCSGRFNENQIKWIQSMILPKKKKGMF